MSLREQIKAAITAIANDVKKLMKTKADYHESVFTGLTVLNDTDHIKFTRTGNVCVIYIYGNTIDTQFNVKDGLTEMDHPEESGFHPLKLTTADNQSIIPEGYKPFSNTEFKSISSNGDSLVVNKDGSMVLKVTNLANRFTANLAFTYVTADNEPAE